MITFILCLIPISIFLASVFCGIEAKMECLDLRREIEVKEAYIEKLKKDKEKLKKENKALSMELFCNLKRIKK